MDIVRLRLASRSALQLKSIKNSRPRAYVMSAPGLWGSPREFSPSDVVETGVHSIAYYWNSDCVRPVVSVGSPLRLC